MKPYAIYDQTIPYYLTWTTVDWIDIFTRQRYRDIVIESLKHCMQHKGLILYAYVIMSNHLHLIAQAKQSFQLSDIVRDCKKFTSKQIIEAMHVQPESRRSWLTTVTKAHGLSNPNNKFNQVWQQDNHAVELTDLRRFYQKLAYIHMNPVKAGIVTEPEHYLYSSARNYAGLSSVLDITLMEIMPLDGYLRPL